MKTINYKGKACIVLLSVLMSTLVYAHASEVTGTLSTGLGNNSVSGIVVAAPVATPGTGSYTSTQTVALTSVGSLSIHYTTDGSTPTCTTGNTYGSAITVASSQTISAISCYANSATSSISSNVYTITIVTSGGGGGGGGGGSSYDTTPPTNTSISLNAGATTTSSLTVNVTLGATEASQMIISNDAGFAGASWETYSTVKSWVLTSGDGIKTVYAKFRDFTGNMSTAISDTIVLSGSGTVFVASNIPTEGCSNGNLYNTSTGALCINNSYPQGCSGGNKYNTSTGALCINNTAPLGQVLGATIALFNRDLRVGSRGNDVKELQKIFIAGGFLNVEATGYFGTLTAKALTKWQIKNGLIVSQTFGKSHRDFINANNGINGQVLGVTTVHIFLKDLKLGTRGNDVKELQKILISTKFLALNTPTDYFGTMTQTALRKWQLANGLPVTGYLDQATRTFLNNR